MQNTVGIICAMYMFCLSAVAACDANTRDSGAVFSLQGKLLDASVCTVTYPHMYHFVSSLDHCDGVSLLPNRGRTAGSLTELLQPAKNARIIPLKTIN